MRQKLLSRAGETLTETLVAVLVVALSALILATLTATSVNLDNTALKISGQFYEELSAAEGAEQGADGTAVLSGDLDGSAVSLPITYYGQDGRLTSYRAKGAGGP